MSDYIISNDELIVTSMPLLDGSLYDLQCSDMQLWDTIYVYTDTSYEYRKMLGWLDSHPKQRKTRRGMKKFINGWLASADKEARENERSKPKTQSTIERLTDRSWAEAPPRAN